MQAGLYNTGGWLLIQDNKSGYRDTEDLIQICHSGPGKKKSKEMGLLTLSSDQWEEIPCFSSSYCLILTLFWFKAGFAPLYSV